MTELNFVERIGLEVLRAADRQGRVPYSRVVRCRAGGDPAH